MRSLKKKRRSFLLSFIIRRRRKMKTNLGLLKISNKEDILWGILL